ncbi:efflux RND transporter permease subunit [bacterium]|nr:efflux RND transporter permease subunit [bacterium]
MIERIIELSIRNRFVVLIAYVLVVALGIYSVANTPVDAIPDLSENQVIVFTDWMGRSPREIEDQITYPLSVNLQGLAGVKSVRSSSEFNFSMINVIFEDDVDFYFARQRVSERLTLASTFLPQGVVPYRAPDATALGQIFWYTVEGANQEPGRLRAIQDWFVRYQLNSVPGVSQVASVGGFPIEYQIDVDPIKLRAYGVTLGQVYDAVARSNSAVGGRVVHKGKAEYLIRGVGWIQSIEDIRDIVIRSATQRGTPISVSNLATVSQGPQFRRSTLEKDGNEATCGVDRTRLIQGAIHTLTEILTHEMVIATIAILLILGHARSAFVICLTLPLSVLVSFILMRRFGIASNIMSLSGIAISIGILVDQAIVMVENATHHLTAHFQGGRITGDTRELVIPACKTVGRPIFFSVLIILLSFIPVFALRGMEGKTFHPLAFTKTFAMIGVAIMSITLVPALIPTFIKGKLKSEEQNWIVRSLIRIYKPVLSWALDYPKTVNWFFVVLLALGWHLWGKIGREYMPPLDEGSILDMPITVPRASIAETSDDLKARDKVLLSFPEVEQVVGKGGRADTPTDPSPLDMIETVVNLRPKEQWPKRAIRYEDARKEADLALAKLEERGYVRPASQELDRRSLVDAATMSAISRFDATLRAFVLERHRELEARLAHDLARDFVGELVRRLERARRLRRAVANDEIARIGEALSGKEGPILAKAAAQEDANRLVQEVASKLAAAGAVETDEKGQPSPELLAPDDSWRSGKLGDALDLLGVERPTLFTEMLAFAHERREEIWRERVKSLDYEVFDRAVGAFDWFSLEELAKEARERGLFSRDLASPAPRSGSPFPLGSPLLAEMKAVREELDGPFARRLFLWKQTKSDLVKEMDSVLQVPGWGNIWTQPIINRIDMLATGVRTMIGVKVFGKDQDEIQRCSEEVAAALRGVQGAVDVFPDQNVGKGYIEVDIDRKKAARYGVSVGDIQDVIEVALGGKVITSTVEGRERHPVRVRYARDWREDEQKIKVLLVSTGGMDSRSDVAASGALDMGTGGAPMAGDMTHLHARSRPLQIPLGLLADVKVVEGPSMIKSENGLLRSYVQLNVRDRDIVGFVAEAQRVVSQKVKLPSGMYLEWSGQFEHQVRARKTLSLVFPAVILLIFIVLYLTYSDLVDALLMMMAVPEALVGGIFFLWLFGFNFSVAVWVGFIACFGMATETGIIMLVYLREAIERKGGLSGIRSLDELRKTVIEGAVHRLRPKLLTEGVAIVSLAPMLWASGVGHEVISAMAAPVLGGLLISDEVVDLFIPVRFFWVRRARWLALHGFTEDDVEAGRAVVPSPAPDGEAAEGPGHA